MTIDASLEIRKLAPSHIVQLSSILEYTDQWKKLMAIVPKTLTKNDFECSIISCDNPAKYNSDHIRLIETAAHKYKRTATEIFLDEWACSGRVRPTIGHLLSLLVRAELFRAADYVAEKVLHVDPPKRPNQGPAASISTDINKHIEGKLNEMNYSSSLIENVALLSSFNNNRNCSIPRIVVTPEEEIDVIKFKVDEFASNEDNASAEVSSMMKFSIAEESEDNSIPQTSETKFLSSGVSPTYASWIEEGNHNLPLVSMLMGQSSNRNIPNLSELMDGGDKESTVNSSGFFIPKMRQFCASPLPNLTLSTNLPHFKYYELETATNHFNENPYGGDQETGRFLGSGAFGKVFLGTGLLERPVAVKKLLLENAEAVTVDDTITKQFVNEVEVLSKFKHENLLLLLGYSCDGSTYCLLYEYISGGTLKDKLKRNDDTLTWQERISIACGTSKAISYLHTAFPSSPLIHRDIKTANILLDARNEPKLGDFGITKLLNNSNNTNTCTVMGTSAYMAPEALRGDISVKCDTFSFGVVLLELLTSLPVYDEERDGNDLVTHVEEQCETSIHLLLDKSIGTWSLNDVNFADELYEIAIKCLNEKRKRPVMVDVKEMMLGLMRKLK